MSEDYLLALTLGLLFAGMTLKLFQDLILPIIVKKQTVETEINPKWIKSKVENKYGFQDIDFILAQSSFNNLPYMRIVSEDKKKRKNIRFQFILSEDTSVNDVDLVARMALAGKIYAKYGVIYNDKPLHWLCILCYMLDGGDIAEKETSWSAKN